MIVAVSRAVAALALGLVLASGSFAREARADAPRLLGLPDDSRVCGVLARAAEKALSFPEHLLRAVGVVESGRFDRTLGRAEPWPWTINAAGKGATFRTKAEAIAEVERLQRSGVNSIDVGCMQVNLAYHGDAFESLDDAFDPVTNVAYAAHFLDTLKQEHGTWNAAVAAYHSATPERGIPYRRKVAQTWHGLRTTIAEDAVKLRRAAVLEGYEKRRAEFAEHQARVLEIQKERREARKKQRKSPPAQDVLEVRGNTASSANDQRDTGPKPTPGAIVGSLPEPGNRLVDDRRTSAGAERVAQTCVDFFAVNPAGRAPGFDRGLMRQMLEISARDAPDSELIDDGFVRERSELFEGSTRWRDGPFDVVRASAGLMIDDPGPLSSSRTSSGPLARARQPLAELSAGCPRVTEQKPARGAPRVKVPSVIRG